MSYDQDWFHDLTTEDSKQERATLAQRVIVVLGVICALVLVGLATNAHAIPLFQAEAEGIKIVLTDEDCRLPAVSNLPKRATWHEKGKVFEGCFGAHPMFPVIMGYFADKTVVVLPVEMFTRVSGA